MTLCSDTAKPPPAKAPFRLLAEQKHLLPYCAAQTPPQHTCILMPGEEEGSAGPYAAEAAHLVLQTFCAAHSRSVSIHLCVSGTNRRERETQRLREGERERGTRLQLQDE